MKHLIYVTTAMDEKDFKEYIKHWKSAPNPSNQNFHNKLIRCLSLQNFVDVISIRPFSRSLCDLKKLEKDRKVEGNITWHYLAIERNVFSKFVNCQSQINKLIKEIIKDDTIIFTDTINPALVHFVKHALKKYNNKVIGVVTDSPSNISNTGKSFATYLLSNATHFDGYLALTKELDELYNIDKKPSCVVEGLVEERHFENKTPLAAKYFFFGGALLPRYGIYQLIEAFNKFNQEYQDYYLLIAGHHGDENKLLNAIGTNTNIRYLKMLPVDEVLFLEQHSVANINPRPFSEDLDRFSIPSKTIEYLVSGRPTISVKNTKLSKYFQEEIIWSKSSSVEDLYQALVKVVTAPIDLQNEFGEKGKQKALAYFSFEAVYEKIENELFDKI